MPRKIEDWSLEIYNGPANLSEKYDKLSGRELVIVASSVLDIGLAHLIEKRLRNDPKEIEGFLGMDGDGRAPAGSFGSKIQLAYLLGLIDQSQRDVLRAIKQVRNIMAHKVKRNLTSPDANREIQKLIPLFTELSLAIDRLDRRPKSERFDNYKAQTKASERVACTVILVVVSYMEVIIDGMIKATRSLDHDKRFQESLQRLGKALIIKSKTL